MTVSVVIPTYRRPDSLARCLDGLARQTRLPEEVLVAVRVDDDASRAVVASFTGGRLPVIEVPLVDGGASEGRNRCLAVASGEVIAFTDDDTVPRPDWVARIDDRFRADPASGGLGGPDWIEGREVPLEHRPAVVGQVQWFGRRVGNHHRGAVRALRVDWLKGANMSFRREALHGIEFGQGLRGRAAQFAEDFAISTAVRRRGWILRYDPEVAVDHYPGVLAAQSDHRSLADLVSLADAAHNETVVLLDHLPRHRQPVFLLWAILVGTRLLPGALMTCLLVVTRRRLALFGRGRVIVAARLEGWRTWRLARSTGRSAPAATQSAGVPAGTSVPEGR